MAKIAEYSKITKLKDNDIFLVDGPDGTRTILKKNAAKELVGEIIETETSTGNPTKIIYKAYDENIELGRAEDISELKTRLATEKIERQAADTTLQNNINAERTRAQEEEARIESLFVTPTQEAVDNWLSEHPEATTTVQDESLTEEKFTSALRLKTINSYVTPEMFGAIGDGVSNDTTAIQNAVNSSKNVIFGNQKTYKTGKITITSGNKILDFNNSDIICTDETFLECKSDFDSLLYSGEYAANTNIGISALNNYMGLVFIDSDINIMPGRGVYRGGCATKCDKGVLQTTLPYSLSACSIYGQTNGISNIIIKNIHSIDGTQSTTKGLINFYGISDVLFENVRFTSKQYIGLLLNRCTNVLVRSCSIHVQADYSNFNNVNVYGVTISDGCSYVTIENSEFYSNIWHCITTGGKHTNIHTKIINSVMELIDNTSSNPHAYAYLDHGNTIDTFIDNCTIISGAGITDGTIANCIFNKSSAFDDTEHSKIALFGWIGDNYHSKFTIKNCRSDNEKIQILVAQDIMSPTQNAMIQQINSICISDCAYDNSVWLLFSSSTVNAVLTDFSISNLYVNSVKKFQCSIGQFIEESFIINSLIAGQVLYPFPNYDNIFSKKTIMRFSNCEFTNNFATNVYINELYMDNCSMKAAGNKKLYVKERCVINNCYFGANIDNFNLVNGCNYLLSGIVSGNLSDLYKPSDTNIYYKKTSPNAEWAQGTATPL